MKKQFITFKKIKFQRNITFFIFEIRTKNIGRLKLQNGGIKNRKIFCAHCASASWCAQKPGFSQMCSEFSNHELSAKLSSAHGARRARQKFYILTKLWYMVSFPVNIMLRALVSSEIYFSKLGSQNYTAKSF